MAAGGVLDQSSPEARRQFKLRSLLKICTLRIRVLSTFNPDPLLYDSSISKVLGKAFRVVKVL